MKHASKINHFKNKKINKGQIYIYIYVCRDKNT